MPAPAVLHQSDLRAAIPRNRVSSTAGSSIVNVGHASACKCEICTCGGHRCKVEKDCTTHYDPDVLQSTAAHDYNHKHASPAKSAAPIRSYQPSPAKFDGETTYQHDHHGQAGKPASPIRPNGNNDTIHPNNDRYWSTESRNEYDNKGYQRRDGFKPKAALPPPVVFDGTTSNKADFRNWDGAKPSTPFKAKNELATAPESRDFQSEAQLQYHAHPYSKAEPFIPARGAANNAKFEGKSTNSTDYQKWNASPAQPFRPVGNQQAVSETRDFESESRHEYGKKNASPAKSAAPIRSYQPSPAKFDGETTYQHDHHGQAGKAATPFIPNGNNDTIHPNNDRSWSTEQRGEYANKGYQRRDGFKPKAALPPPVVFDGTTSNKADFRNWDGAKPSTPFKAKNELATAPESRDFQSEAQLQYHAHPYSKAEPFIPARGAANNAKFEGTSTSASDFQSYVFAPCPAEKLSDATQKLASGHLMYKQTPRGSWQTTTGSSR